MPLSDFPLSVAVISAIEATKLSTEGILRFHKTGLGTLTYEEISLLENYTYLWNIDGNVWIDVCTNSGICYCYLYYGFWLVQE